MSEYQSACASDFLHTDCECQLCRSHGKGAGHHHTCHYQDDNDWDQFVISSDDTKFQEVTQLTELQAALRTPLRPIDPALFVGYTTLSVEQHGVQVFKQDIARMYEHYK